MKDHGLDEPVGLVDHRQEWAVQARELAADARACVDPMEVDVEHIGSTAVPGLVAKPVIDMLLGVSAPSVRTAASSLARAGWQWFGEAGVPGRQYLRLRGRDVDANAHVVERDSRLWAEDVMFRDYLRGNLDATRRYAAGKRQAALQASGLLDYSELKRELVQGLLEEARSGNGRPKPTHRETGLPGRTRGMSKRQASTLSRSFRRP